MIGAGIAGLAAARSLAAQGAEVLLLEARDRVGGRARSEICAGGGAVDLGPAWIWPSFQPRLRQLLEELQIETLPQYEEGRFVYETADGDVRHLDYPRRYGDAVRVRGGLGAFAGALAGDLSGTDVRLGVEIVGVDIDEASVTVSDAGGEAYVGHQLIAAVPPAIVAAWTINPALDPQLVQALLRWPTWMAAHAKFAAIYTAPFWRAQGLSGSAVSHRGPLMEIVDHSDDALDHYALIGFFGVPARERARANSDDLKDAALAQFVRCFGTQANDAQATLMMDWSTERFTAVETDLDAGSRHPPYGEPALRQSWFGGRLLLASAESSDIHGGLVEGALLSGERAARQLRTNA